MNSRRSQARVAGRPVPRLHREGAAPRRGGKVPRRAASHSCRTLLRRRDRYLRGGDAPRVIPGRGLDRRPDPPRRRLAREAPDRARALRGPTASALRLARVAVRLERPELECADEHGPRHLAFASREARGGIPRVDGLPRHVRGSQVGVRGLLDCGSDASPQGTGARCLRLLSEIRAGIPRAAAARARAAPADRGSPDRGAGARREGNVLEGEQHFRGIVLPLPTGHMPPTLHFRLVRI